MPHISYLVSHVSYHIDMFGISGAEFLIVLIIAIAVVPAKNWPDVARMVGKFVRYVKNIIGKLQDGIDNFENEVAKDLPLDNLSQKTMDDMIETFSTPVKKRRKK